MMVKTKENLKQNCNDFHKKTNIPSLISKRGREERKEKEEDKKKKVKGKTGKKNTFPPICKKEGKL